MKHFYRSAVIFFLLLSVHTSRGQVIFSENFEQGIPNTWTLIDGDGFTVSDSVYWVTAPWIGWVDITDTLNHVAESTSWFNPPGTADRWMVTPPIQIKDSNYLQWRAHALDPNNPDGYQVWIDTVHDSIPLETDFTSNPAHILLTIPAENPNWTTHALPLYAYAGKTVRIAFQNNSDNDYLLDVDDILIGTHLLHDLAVDSGVIPQYSQTPLRMVQPVSFGARVANVGLDTCLNVHVYVNVFLAGSAVYNDSSAVLSRLADSTSQFITIPGTYTPADTGVYTVQYIVNTTSKDTSPGNDTLVEFFTITDSVYARDEGQPAGSVSLYNPGGAYLGQTFAITDTIALTSVTMLLDNPTIGDTVSAVVFRLDSIPPDTIHYTATDSTSFDSIIIPGYIAPDTLVATSYLFLIAQSARQWVTVQIHSGSKVLLPGKYVVAAEQYSHGITLALDSNIFTPGTTWLLNPIDSGTWENNEVFGITSTYMLRPNFSRPCLLIPDTILTTLPTCSYKADGAIKLIVSGFDTIAYKWSQGSLIDSIGDVSILVTYRVTATDAFGCQVIDSVLLTNPAPLNDSIVQTCGYAYPDTVTGGTPPYTYLWTNQAHADTIDTFTVKGYYFLLITDNNGCALKDSVFYNGALKVSLGSDYIGDIPGSAYVQNVAGGTPPYSYLWNTRDTIDSITVSTPGYYYVTITDARGCSINDSVFVVEHEGIAWVSSGIGITAYPNPADASMNINIVAATRDNIHLQVFNNIGQLMYEQAAVLTNQLNIMLDMSEWPAGIYILNVQTTDGVKTQKVMKE